MNKHADLELEMKIPRRDLRARLLHEFCLTHKTIKATSNICHTMVKDKLSICTVQRWFIRVKKENFKLNDLPHTGRPIKVDTDLLKELIEEDPRVTAQCLAKRLECSHITVETHLYELGKT